RTLKNINPWSRLPVREGSRIAQRSDGSRAIGGLVWRPCRASSARIAPGAGPCRRSSEKSSKALLYQKTALADCSVVPPGRALCAEPWRADAELRDGVQHR